MEIKKKKGKIKSFRVNVRIVLCKNSLKINIAQRVI